MTRLRTPLLAACLAALALCLGAPGAARAADMPPSAGPGVHVLAPMTIPGLDRQRTIRVYLPPGYSTSNKRYPVLYMHDGQNLFDDATSYVGEWGVDEALDQLAKEGLSVIVVGIDHGNEKRMTELNAWDNAKFGKGEGKQYTDFIVKVLKPWVDANYRTRPGRKDTGIMGSSMGGLASHYALFQYPEVFSMAGIFSPAYWTAPPVAEWTKARTPGKHDRIYMIAGGKEGEEMTGQFAAMDRQLRAIDKRTPEIHSEVIAGAEHNERFWRGEFPKAVRFLYGAQ
jgi:predicted alpha/beta superfamily hydrolase